MNEQLDRIEMKQRELEGKLDAVFQSSEKMRKYMLWGFWITVGAIALPLLVLPLVLPAFLSSLTIPAGF
ncbi:MAG TPA: hypothetical protein VHD31_01575 [Candidatus Paceibacterota bacterium]|nr:hypothetical protein [Candidatus Paceibacterota bacterium]